VVVVLVVLSPMPVWAWLLSVWVALGLLKIRTFLEHRAHDKARARTVVIEARGPLAMLFLNNSLHVVHHMHPRVAWYRLPALYAERRQHYLARNEGYAYRSYAEVARRYLLTPKDPVPHPTWTPEARVGQRQAGD
jgi:fatty acid desaturase